MRLAGGLLLLLLLLLIIPDGALSATAAAAGRGCQRRCGGLVVPYPFGFSGSCPIKLACNESSSTPAALVSSTSEEGNNATAADRSPYTVVKFNATTSTFVVSLPPSCNRTVSGARRWLAGANYGVSSRTGLFLRGCLNATTTNCSVPVETMLRTTRCGNQTTSSLTCIASLSADSTAAAAAAAAERGEGLFVKWERVEEPRCDNLMTSVYGDTREGVFSLEFSMAELGWWVNGSCSNHSAGGGGDDLARCAANATCIPVQTPSGEWAHRCGCLPGMDGDGFAAGEGCFFSGEWGPLPGVPQFNYMKPTRRNADEMHLSGDLLLLLCVCVQLLLILPDGALSASPATAGGDLCRRKCGGLAVPYPFGFSGDCPILLSCDEGNSTAALLRPATNGTSTTAESSSSYAVVGTSFNSTASTLLVSLPPSCNRTVSDARRWLTGANYGVSSRTGLFLRGCQNATSTNCTVPAEVIVRTPKCGGGGGNESASTVTCIATISTETDMAKGSGMFARWDMVEAPRCDNLLSSVYGETKEQLFSLEFAVAEMGWWVNGSCSNNHSAGAGGDLAGRCAANATCFDVQTPSGGWGHQCRCMEGMDGDGFAAGEGCHFPAKKSSTKKILIIVGGVLVGTVAAGVLLCCVRRRRSGGGGRSGFDRLAAKRLLSEAASSSGVPVYSYHEVTRATNSFSHTHRLGTGAYGTVYVGKLPSPSPSLVAIKRLRRRYDDDDDTAVAVLLNEVKLISSLSHPNLVRLLGCCLDRGEQILVYEFVPNGTLAHHLAGGGLPWRARLGVAAETAAAIAYLHAKRPPILHRDVKSSNILLDGDLRPKLADFGLSRAVGRLEASVSHVSTAPQGTPGYVDPEYHQNFHLSDKSDVYSFGVVLLELITAMKVVDFARPAAEVNLASLALDRIGKGRVDDIVDPALVDRGDEWVMRSVRHVSELAFRCLAFQKDVRPCMSEVAAELARIRDAAPASVPGAQTGVGSRAMVIDVGFDGVAAAVKKAGSPVSVQDVWVSDQSSPSTNGSMPRFA
uniref:Protein kinase domain-containing protein n=1 Tax=Oryza punctata TaxID=4537 RepID=A0A0E0MP92_ORYPU